MGSLSLRLARSTIKMRHTPSWRIDKLNPAHGEEVVVEPGEALLIRAYERFVGRHGGGDELYTGIAQHFYLELFGRGDIIRQMSLRRKVRLSRWDTLGPLARHYRESAPVTSTTLIQHHQFMVLLLAYLEDAFLEWRTVETPVSQDHLSMQIMFVASRLSAARLLPPRLPRPHGHDPRRSSAS
jgi:hypothetical protein